MKRIPTTAKLAASRRRLRTTNLSAAGPCMLRHSNWLISQGASERVLPRMLPVIDREQVLHVARLARLRLSEEEVETMVGELSGILEHVDRIGKLDLDGVEPTSHVVALENVLRADEPRPSLPRDVALAPAPEPVDGAFRVPSPQADA
jgi:aspartyl-tRNA(Asn)/glutamyl-tRNA(Gln) amidotransferase subunit C